MGIHKASYIATYVTNLGTSISYTLYIAQLGHLASLCIPTILLMLHPCTTVHIACIVHAYTYFCLSFAQ